MHAIASINHWIHLISAVIWIGGLGFIVMTLAPSLRGKFSQESTKLLFQDIRKRYYRMIGILLTLTLVSGGLNVHFSLQDMARATKPWLIFLGIKLLLVTAIASIYLLNLQYKSKPVESGEQAIPYANISFILGAFIILTAAIMRHSH